MAEDGSKLKRRLAELEERAYNTGVACSSRFLNIAEQSEAREAIFGIRLEGGYEGAERRVAVFGKTDGLPIACVKIAPVSKKFSDELTHRDFLGALMGLGIKREMLGDIVLVGGAGYLFCLDEIAPVIISELTEVKRTTVRCEYSALPDDAAREGEEKSLVVSSERLDAVLAAVYRLSRSEAKEFCEKGLVYVDSRLVTKAGAELDEGARVTLRGRGRFTFLGIERETKKGRLRVLVRV